MTPVDLSARSAPAHVDDANADADAKAPENKLRDVLSASRVDRNHEVTQGEMMRHASLRGTDLRNLFAEYERRLAALPPVSARHFSQGYPRSPEIPVEEPPFLSRDRLNALDKEVMSAPFSVSHDTEMPAISGPETLTCHYARRFPDVPAARIVALAQEGFAFYTMRQMAKKGRQLDGSTLDGKTNQIADTSDEVLALRKFAGDVVVSHPLSAQIKPNGEDFEGFYDQVIKNIQTAGNDDNEPTVVRVLHPSKSPQVVGYTINYFSQCFSAYLTDRLNEVAAKRQAQDRDAPRVAFTNDGHITTLCRTSRAEATPIGRLGQLGYFSANSVNRGEFIIIADDHAQSGDAWMTALLASKRGGAQTVGLAAFSIHPFSQNGLFDAQIQSRVLAKLHQSDPQGLVLKALGEIGITPETITNFEALILLALFTDPTDAVGLEAYHGIVAKLSGEAKILTSAFDSLDPVVSQPALTPAEFIVQLTTEIAANRQVIADVDAQKNS